MAALLAVAAQPTTWAYGQNLDAGKPASQIFAEVCANCHRSPREVRNNASVGFLREHYTTGSEMASSIAAYLSGGADSRTSGQPQPKRQAAPAATTRDTPAASTAARDTPAANTAARDTPAADNAREPRHAAQPVPDPKPQSGPTTRGHPATAEAKPLIAPPPPVPVPPALEEFEE